MCVYIYIYIYIYVLGRLPGEGDGRDDVRRDLSYYNTLVHIYIHT